MGSDSPGIMPSARIRGRTPGHVPWNAWHPPGRGWLFRHLYVKSLPAPSLVLTHDVSLTDCAAKYGMNHLPKPSMSKDGGRTVSVRLNFRAGTLLQARQAGTRQFRGIVTREGYVLVNANAAKSNRASGRGGHCPLESWSAAGLHGVGDRAVEGWAPAGAMGTSGGIT